VGGVDLHVHTTVSDGKFSPQQIVAKAAGLGLNTIAITDHDNTDGVAPSLEAARAYPQLRVIPGVEISTQAPGSEVHLLGYFIDYNDPKLSGTLEELRRSRLGRAQAMISKLNELGVDIDWQQVKGIAGDSTVGRPHIARAMLENGCIDSWNEAFEKYIGQGGPAYVERHKITPAEAVSLVLAAGGLPVLAHPFTVEQPEELISELKTKGLAGIEVYYNDYSVEKRGILARLAEKYDLIATAAATTTASTKAPRQCWVTPACRSWPPTT
jgi:predicted metal-dependent phosphoesterase TrpH